MNLFSFSIKRKMIATLSKIENATSAGVLKMLDNSSLIKFRGITFFSYFLKFKFILCQLCPF